MAASVDVSYDLSVSSASEFSDDDDEYEEANCSSGRTEGDDENSHSSDDGGSDDDMDSMDEEPGGSSPSRSKDAAAAATSTMPSESEQAVGKRSGLAAVMASILAKQLPDAAEPILAKAKTEKEILAAKRKSSDAAAGQQQIALDVVPADGSNEREETAEAASRSTTNDELAPAKLKRKRLSKVQKKRKADNLCRAKPKVTEKTFEKTLQKIAARGVVQLFNAVRQQQKQTDEKLQAVGSSEVKRQQVLRTFTKGSFLDMLKANGSTATTVIRSNGSGTSSIGSSKQRISLADSGMATVSFATRQPKNAAQQPSWKVLRDDFMMGGNMKDWDKESEDAGV